MDIRQLLEFIDLAKTCHFQETAANLNTSQSSLSKHMHRLEEELGIQLFDRVSRTVQLNQYGAAFLPYARKIVDLSNAATSELGNLISHKNSILNVGFHPTLAQYGLVELTSRFNKLHPEITIKLIETNDPEETLKTFQCDVVFAWEDEITGTNYQRVNYMHDNLVVVCADSHPFAQETSVSLAELKNEDFVVHSGFFFGSANISSPFFKICRDVGKFTPNVVATASRTATVARFVSQKNGIALLFRRYVPVDIGGITVVDLLPEISTNLCVFCLKNHHLPLSVKTFLEYLRSINLPDNAPVPPPEESLPPEERPFSER